MPPNSKSPTSVEKLKNEKKSNVNGKKEMTATPPEPSFQTATPPAAGTDKNSIISSRLDYYRETPARTKRQLTLWSFILISSVVILFILEKAFVLNPIMNKVVSSSSTSHDHDFSDLKSLRSSILLGEGGLVLVDVREEFEIISDGYHPSSVLIPYSGLCKFVAKNFQHLPASQGFHMLLLNLMTSGQSVNAQWKLTVLFTFVSNVVVQEFNYFFRNQHSPEKFSFIKTVFDFLFLTEDQFKTGRNQVLFSQEKIIGEVEFHHSNKTKLFSASRERNIVSTPPGSEDADDKEIRNFYKNSVSSLDKLKKAKTVLVICSETGLRSQIAALYLKHLLFHDEAVDIFSLKESFVELLPVNFHDKTFRKFGFVRDDLKPRKSLTDSFSKRKEKGWATPEIEAILATERKNKKK